MSKITKRGIVKKVGTVETVGVNQTKKQVLVLHVPSRKDDFGVPYGDDDYFELAAIGKKVEALNLQSNLLEKKVEVEFYINGRMYDKIDNTVGYAINANIMSVKVLEDRAPATATTTNEVPKNF